MAVVNTDAPKFSKRRKLGKNKKKSWRAANIKDIEEFLDDERRQKESGGLVAEKADEALFVVDTGKPEAPVLGTTPKKSRNRQKLLKCHALLEPDPNSRSVRKSEASNYKKGKRTQRILDCLRAKSGTQKGVTAGIQRQEAIIRREKRREEKRKLPEVTHDMWADTDDYKSKVKPPKKYRKKPSALGATLVPHPGSSVNPSFADHQDLVQLAVTIEQKKEKKAKQLNKAVKEILSTQDKVSKEEIFITEMSVGLVDPSDEEDETQNDEEDATLSVNPPVRRENKKTRKQRNTQEKLSKEAKDREKVTDLRRRENMVLRIRSLKSEIRKEEVKRKEREVVKRKLKEQEPYQTKRLGSIRYADPDLDVKLSTELVASLREVKPEGHLLKDMYSSLCKRNIVEPRIPQLRKRKYKRKVLERRGQKAVTL